MRWDTARLSGRCLPADGCEGCAIRIDIDHCKLDRCFRYDRENRQRRTTRQAAALTDLVNCGESSVTATSALLTLSNGLYFSADMGWPSASPSTPKLATPSLEGVHVLACNGVDTIRIVHRPSASLARLATDRDTALGILPRGSFEECSLHFGLSPGLCHQPDRRCMLSAWQPHLELPFHFQRHVHPALLRYRTLVRSRAKKRY